MHPLIIFKNESNYYYIKYCNKIDVKRTKGSNEIEITIDTNSSLKHDIYVDISQIFTISASNFHSYCFEQKISYISLNGDYISNNGRQKIINKLSKRLSKISPEVCITYVNLNAVNQPKFDIEYCHEKLLEDELILFAKYAKPYTYENNYDSYRDSQRVTILINSIFFNSEEYLNAIDNGDEENIFIKIINYFNKLNDKSDKLISNFRNVKKETLFSIENNYFIINQNYVLVGLTEEGKKQKELVIPKNIRSIGKIAFKNCQFLKQIDFEKNSALERIDSNTFEKCEFLSEITIPGSMKYIGDYAFNRKKFLESIVFENNSTLEYIGDCAFHWCTGLEEIKIPASVKTINYGTFANCKNLELFTFEVESQCQNIDLDTFNGCSLLNWIEIPKSMESINDNAFTNCFNLKQVTFEEGSKCQYIGKNAFSECQLLKEIIIPDSIKKNRWKCFWKNN